ncbi:eukaryotic-like serine/threonine-protein kinase [Spiroplasma chinense]|uniref:non-specific serine/threonine protein kinase n=1 Tax=Spiroplasma chinense TaxID=216932 RepID=A0A5B9Y640_9MOLU|nr:serine/threonine-protein kinase [Spiroplasma chinense]QEH62186.1 eukaryotic-like serine/threonine-protein kinase [Spiroplasma chinense]
MTKYEAGDMIDGRYEIIKGLGKGGMATVYKALDLITKTFVAIKVMAPDIVVKEAGQERFDVEKESFAKLWDNQYTVKLFDVLQHGAEWFIVLECVEGGTLKDKIKDYGAMTLTEIKNYFIPLCDALQSAHNLQIVHRDIKPDNILLTPAGVVKLGDFGISIMPGYESEAEKAIGTPRYMAPEVLMKMRATPKSDIYSLGIVLYECAVGVAPFIAQDQHMIAKKHIVEKPTPPRQINSSVSQGLENIILKMIEKDPEYRFKNMNEIKIALTNLKSNDNSKPYFYQSRLNNWTNIPSNNKVKIGNTYENLPLTSKTKFTAIFSILFLALILVFVVVLLVL